MKKRLHKIELEKLKKLEIEQQKSPRHKQMTRKSAKEDAEEYEKALI